MEPSKSPSQPVASTVPNSEISKKSYKKLALWLLIAPTALLIVTFILYLFLNGLLEEVNVARGIANVILFISGLVGIIAWLPGLITGIVLLVTKK